MGGIETSPMPNKVRPSPLFFELSVVPAGSFAFLDRLTSLRDFEHLTGENCRPGSKCSEAEIYLRAQSIINRMQ